MPTAAEAIRDDIIAQDIRYKRADATIRREVDARLDKLETEIVALMLRIDVAGTKQRKARARRLAKLHREVGIATRTAYSEINGIIKSGARRVARVEAASAVKIVAENLP
jgi:transcription elongation factor